MHIPITAIMNVTILGGAPNIVFFIKADINPILSASPMPKAIVKTNPKGANPVKFFITLVNAKVIPSADSRFFATTSSPVEGLIAFTPVIEHISDMIQRITISQRNKING